MLAHGSCAELLHAERDALVRTVHFEHDGLDLVAFLEDFGRVIDFARPGHVGHVDHAVNALLQFHKRAVAGEVAHLALDAGADRVFRFGIVPRIGFELADAEGDFLFLAIDAEHDGLDFLVLLEHVAGLGHALGPRQFGDVHESFDAHLQLHERAVRHEVDDLALDLGADGILVSMLSHGLAIFCLRPRLTRSFSLFTSSTTTSISWPTLSISDG